MEQQFKDRLSNYRKSLGFTQRMLASELDISENYYSLFENGVRKPSRNFLIKLVNHSGKPEEYWLKGVTDKEYYIERVKNKSLNTVIDTLFDLKVIKDENDIDNLFNNIKCPPNGYEHLILESIKVDLEAELKRKEMFKKRKENIDNENK